MILIAGIPTESPMAFAVDAAEESGIDYQLLDQREHANCDLRLELDTFTGWRGILVTPSGQVDLSAVDGIYVRLMDERFLPDVRDAQENSRLRSRAASFHALLHAWFDIAPGRIANRPRSMLSNMSKTYQAGIIQRCGFAIPETLVTNNPDEALDFQRYCSRDGDEVIYKSVSGARSIVQTFTGADRERLHRIRSCPTQFQRKVRGDDIRVHVIGCDVFGVSIRSEATDYRYAQRQAGEDAELSAIELSDELKNACVRLALTLNLPFCGIDLRRTPASEHFCFEVNPCPAYSYYESRTGVPIARALVHWLSGHETRVSVAPLHS